MHTHSFKALLVVSTLVFAVPSIAAAPSGDAPAAAARCEHGVKKSLCTRCNPKLEAVFKSKGDWCAEHKRPESQCAICKPELAKEGVKP